MRKKRKEENRNDLGRGIICVLLVLLVSACGSRAQNTTAEGSVLEDTAVSAEEEEPSGQTEETAFSKPEKPEEPADPDTRYESKAMEPTVSEFTEIWEEESDWYGDYQFVEYIRPNTWYTPDFDDEAMERKISFRKKTIMTLETDLERTYMALDKEADVEDRGGWADWNYDHYINESYVKLIASVLDEEKIRHMEERWGKEYERDGSLADFSYRAMGNEKYFADMDFRVHDYEGSPLLIFYNPQRTSAYKEETYLLEAENGTVYMLDDVMVSKWQRLR